MTVDYRYFDVRFLAPCFESCTIYFPKSMRLLHVPEAEVQRVEDLLNDRPRKSLDYATPREVFHAAPDVDPGG